MYSFVEAKASLLVVLQCQLKVAEETSGARERDRHGAEFAKDAVPFLHRSAVLRAGDFI
jgi:hypothetical protein